MFARWPHVHTELAGVSRGVIYRLDGPWLFEGTEGFPKLGATQEVKIGEFGEFGRGLVANGITQIAKVGDEEFTSALVYPAALTALSSERWLIAGGGDGAAAREALRFRGTKSVTIVDISRLVVSATRNFMPFLWAGCEKDKRLNVLNEDIGDFLSRAESYGRKFDIAILDLTDPEGVVYERPGRSPASHVYTEEVFELFRRCLSKTGVLVLQAQELSRLWHLEHKRHRKMLEKVFPTVRSYRIFVEFFGFQQGFVIASKDESWHPRRWSSPMPARARAVYPVEALLSRLYCCPKGQVHPRGYYSTAVHDALFALPPLLEEELNRPE